MAGLAIARAAMLATAATAANAIIANCRRRKIRSGRSWPRLAFASAAVRARSSGLTSASGLEASSIAVERLSLNDGWARSTTTARLASLRSAVSRPTSFRNRSVPRPAAAAANSAARAQRGGSTDQSISSDPQKKAAAAKHSQASDSTQIQPRVCRRSVASDCFKIATSAAAVGRPVSVDAGGSMTSVTGGPWGFGNVWDGGGSESDRMFTRA